MNDVDGLDAMPCPEESWDIFGSISTDLAKVGGSISVRAWGIAPLKSQPKIFLSRFLLILCFPLMRLLIFAYSARHALFRMLWLSAALRSLRVMSSYSLAGLQKARAVFGTVVLECDLDTDAETIYKAYSKRWEIELVMRFYKSALEFDETRVHDDYSVIGSEFCDFLSSVLTFRMIRAFDEAKLLEQMTYKKIMKILARAKMFNDPARGWHLIRINPSYEEILKRLDIHPTEKLQPKKKRGRPPKIKHV